jgi:hypothetical protein
MWIDGKLHEMGMFDSDRNYKVRVRPGSSTITETDPV